MKNPKALLVGNDVNNATSSYSWSDLLKDLIDYAKLDECTSMDGKPFPLFYEEIFLRSAKLYGTKENRIKAYIAAMTRKLKPNVIHTMVINMGIKNIFTTNYDFTLEQVLVNETKNIHNCGIIKENLYNLFRVNKVEGINFWHIHGYENSPATITLGYEHYGGYLQQMRNYVVNGTKGTYKNKDFQALSRRIKDNQVLHESWVDYFFTHDIHIFGLNLDFVEMHLWWLITYRARTKILNKLSINNKIYYYYPEKFAKVSKHKLDLLEVNEIITVALPLEEDDRISYYEKVMTEIDNDIWMPQK